LRKRPTAAEVVARFRARNVDPEGYVLYTYAAIQIFAEAAKKLNAVDPRRIAAALKAQGPWQTVLGPISFDAKGDVAQVVRMRAMAGAPGGERTLAELKAVDPAWPLYGQFAMVGGGTNEIQHSIIAKEMGL
jgi:ABC-type branched-subunit amino acid transport system substrate-binding protein